MDGIRESGIRDGRKGYKDVVSGRICSSPSLHLSIPLQGEREGDINTMLLLIQNYAHAQLVLNSTQYFN